MRLQNKVCIITALGRGIGESIATHFVAQGARVVAHDFEVGGWRADKTEVVEDDGEGRSHTLYLYRR